MAESKNEMLDTKRPDIVVVLTTQWRASALGFAGDPNAITPHLDGIAANSINFTQAVTPHPFGVFARAAFLTGRPCPANGIRDYYDTLPEKSRTLAHAFAGNGYETAFFGKWQLYERDPSAPVVGEAHARIVVPATRRGGFDFWEGFESGFLLNEPLLHGNNIEAPRRFEGYQSDVLVDRFADFCQSRENAKPLFSIISFDAPHPPYGAPAAGISPLDAESIRLLEGTSRDPSERAQARRELAGYYAHIEATDRAIGKLVNRFKENGSWKNTIFVFTSVHGDMHGVDGKFRKGWPHEESVRIPMLLSWPDRFDSAKKSDLLISLSDLGPSLLGLATQFGPKEMSQHGFLSQNLASCILEALPGPIRQHISMPSVPPFAKQCPYVWSASRSASQTDVVPEAGERFSIDHPTPPRFEIEP